MQWLLQAVLRGTILVRRSSLASNVFVYTEPLALQELVGHSPNLLFCIVPMQTLELHPMDAGYAFLQNALSALCKSAQPSRFRDVHRDWDCIPTSRIRTANLQCHACLSLCIYRGTACRCNLEQQSYFIISRIFSRIVWSAGSHCTESSSSFVSQRAASASFRTRSPERTSHQKQSIER